MPIGRLGVTIEREEQALIVTEVMARVLYFIVSDAHLSDAVSGVAHADTRTKSILLVEDEAIITIAEARTMKQFGYEVLTANSGKRTLELATGEQKIDLILMDIDLGKGINGPGAALQILNFLPPTL